MKRALLYSILVMLVSILFATCVYETDDIPKSTGIQLGPSFYLLTPYDRPKIKLKSGYNIIISAILMFIFMTEDIYQEFCFWRLKIIEITLFKDDAEPNADDLVKIYTYHFDGKYMDEVEIDKIDSDNIDS